MMKLKRILCQIGFSEFSIVVYPFLFGQTVRSRKADRYGLSWRYGVLTRGSVPSLGQLLTRPAGTLPRPRAAHLSGIRKEMGFV